MKKYFAMIEGERKGPFTLEELPRIGVTPDTYIWCKGMEDWEPASKDADICRFYRQRLAGIEPADTENPADAAHDSADRQPAIPLRGDEPVRLRDMINEINRIYEEQIEAEEANPYSAPPRIPLIWAILTTLLCFPPTGFVAIYYCIKARKQWSGASAGPEGRSARKAAYETARRAVMLTGITFFLGFIVWAAVVNFV